MSPSPSVSLIINAHRQAASLRLILDRLAEAHIRPDQIIIAEDGEDPETECVMQNSAGRFTAAPLHLRQPHTGFRRSIILNRAIAAATSEYIVFLDGDCIPHREFIRDHRRVARRGTFVQGRRAFVKEAAVPSLLAGKTTLPTLFLTGRMHGCAKALRFPIPLVKEDTDLHGILGCNLGIWRDDLIAVNGYDESFIGWGKEDSDLAARLFHLGRSRRVVRNHAVIFHLDHPVADRTGLPSNEQRLADTLATRRVRALRGIDSTCIST